MQFRTFTVFMLILVSVSGCKTEGCRESEALNYNPEAEKDDGTCNFTKFIFWARYNNYDVGLNNYDVTSIDLKVGGSSTGNITSVYGASPACDAAGCITYHLTSRSKSWSAIIHLENGDTVEKSGSIYASPNQECKGVQIDQ